ncbi:hypothetical protein BZG35_08285 [Brevundimonas sp. LM2]|uniref:trypsin-like serine peptidase n=1 Tax=Brevundimonas sp. LM2 TaxID=1938605 RepID=UPI000983E5AB|nr:hypothetical protein [Brevundimonas sp. LM2]AQR61649.1 hypothetical protein BZG35_08285 [Brevundimonas sp. LM2]
MPKNKIPERLDDREVRTPFGPDDRSLGGFILDPVALETGPREPDRCTTPFMVETNGGGSWESVPGFNAFRARNVGLPAFAGDARTPDPRSAWSPEPRPDLCSDPRPENTIGPDDRVPIPDTTAIPWRSICRLDIRYDTGARALGTAWFVGPRALATAGHNLLHPRAGRAVDIKAWPAFDGVIRYNAPQIQEVVFPDQWRRGFKLDYDYGVILLADGALGHQLGWFGIAGYDDPPQNMPAQVCGYAEGTPSPTQYYNGGRTSHWTEDFVYYTFDTGQGMSGSPVFVRLGEARHVIGIHTYGEPTINRARRLSGHAYDLLRDANAYR